MASLSDICRPSAGPSRAYALGGAGVLLLAAMVAMPALLQAAGPAWAGTANTTSQAYQFTTASTQPAPEVLANGYGAPAATVVVTAPFGTGWQDPSKQFTTPGVNEDGAWDVGPAGTIGFSVPVGAMLTDPGLYYRVDLYIYAVAYEVPVALPVISAPGLALENVTSSTAIVKQETLGRYKSITWSASANLSGSASVNLLLTATAQGAVIDSVEIHTRHTLMGAPQHVYGTWVTANYPGISNPAIAGFNAMPDGDGISNGMKYYLGMDRNARRPVIEITAADAASMTLVHTRNKTGAPDVTAAYEWSTDLANWHSSGQSSGGVTVSFNSSVTDSTDPDFNVLTVTATRSGTPPGRVFARLRVSQ